MKINFIDHIVIIVKSIPETEKFYGSFLDSPVYQSVDTLVYQIKDTKLFFVLPKDSFERSDKDRSGLNHIAFGVRSSEELSAFESSLNNASILHSGIKIDTYGNNEFVWFDDPGGNRVEIYCRPVIQTDSDTRQLKISLILTIAR